MTLGKAFIIIKNYQKWRMGIPPFDTMPCPFPLANKELSEAIDVITLQAEKTIITDETAKKVLDSIGYYTGFNPIVSTSAIKSALIDVFLQSPQHQEPSE